MAKKTQVFSPIVVHTVMKLAKCIDCERVFNSFGISERCHICRYERKLIKTREREKIRYNNLKIKTNSQL